ncbi:MAG: hypothetical protein HY318_12235 [Armatimonadetes bacterium]|nr:hypothetical protein [Armatimonadota bacterium]
MGLNDEIRVPKLFFDADVLIASSASQTGASRALVKGCESTLLIGITSSQACDEAERNLTSKLPHALAIFRLLMQTSLTIVPDPSAAELFPYAGWAREEDLPLLVSAILNDCHFLVTFNARHYFSKTETPVIIRPAELVSRIRGSLSTVR